MGSDSTLEARVGEILLKDWDPIGVSEFAEAADEYEGYVGSICHLISAGGTEEDFFNFLWGVETEHMGLPGDQAATKLVARKLMHLGNGNLS